MDINFSVPLRVPEGDCITARTRCRCRRQFCLWESFWKVRWENGPPTSTIFHLRRHPKQKYLLKAVQSTMWCEWHAEKKRPSSLPPVTVSEMLFWFKSVTYQFHNSFQHAFLRFYPSSLSWNTFLYLSTLGPFSESTWQESQIQTYEFLNLTSRHLSSSKDEVAGTFDFDVNKPLMTKMPAKLPRALSHK